MGNADVEVDQVTGNVYVFTEGRIVGVHREVVEYKPDGSEEITSFGEWAAGNIVGSPGKFHEIGQVRGVLAVDATGDVYLYDTDGIRHCLMVFKPQSPGDYANYVYAGEVVAGLNVQGQAPKQPVTDAAGNVYTVEQEGDAIEEYAPEAPGVYPAPAPSPICRFSFPKSGITAMTVNPLTGEVFFFSYKKEAGFDFKLIHQLSPCAGGEFKEEGVFEVSPERGNLHALAFDSVRQFSPTRSPGVLYGGAPQSTPSGEGAGAGEPGQSALGYIFAPVEENPPAVESEAVSGVTSTTARLGAQINPRGSKTNYVFQYITDAAYEANGPSERFAGASEAPLGGAVLGGNGQEAIAAAVTVSGLAPGTGYHYRTVATSHCSLSDTEKVCEDKGADQAFLTFPAEGQGLIDRRAWELVSPIDKNGGQVFPVAPEFGSCIEEKCKPGTQYKHPMQSAPDGEAVVYMGSPFSSSGEGSRAEDEYISRRTVSGWQTTDLSPPLLRQGAGYAGFNASLTAGVLQQPGLGSQLSPEALSGNPDLYRQPTVSPQVLTPLLTVEPPDRGTEGLLLNYEGGSGDLSKIVFGANDALTEATPFAPAAVDGGPGKRNLYEWSGGQLRLVNVKPGNTETEPGAVLDLARGQAIPADGARVFWSSEGGQVYVREDGERTLEIPDHTGSFLRASTDGSRALLSDGHLYDLETETILDLTSGNGGFQGLVGQSEDLSHVYFVDTAVLDETPNEHGEVAKAGQDNLYAWHEGGTRFVVTLLAKDNSGGSHGISNDLGVVPTVEASPDGEWVAFLSQASLTGYDNTGPCENNHALGLVDAPCPEAFVYDAATGRLRCASCNPTGEHPLGWTVLGHNTPFLTDQGRLFFDSRDSLSPFDTNHGFEDVYEYEPNGVGTCERQAGCVSLISGGHEASDSNFFAMDENGKNVFFTTRDKLTGKDHDDLMDLYDARENGGIPAETAAEPKECAGETCQIPPPPPSSERLGSLTFSGAGNLLTPPAPAGPTAKPKAKGLTRGQQLALALKACKKKHGAKRASCERAARKRFGAVKQAKGK